MAKRVAELRNFALTGVEEYELTSTEVGLPWKRTLFAWAAPVILVASLSAGCSESGRDAASTGSDTASAPTAQVQTLEMPERWYAIENVSRGGVLFSQHCVACHGKNGEGASNWRQTGQDGKYPPPPLNGTGHAWHHPIQVLGAQIKWGAPGGQGNMPPFENRLSDKQIIDVIAWFQDRWSDEIYVRWWQIELRSRQ